MGCVKNSKAMNNYMQRLETLISSDNVSKWILMVFVIDIYMKWQQRDAINVW